MVVKKGVSGSFIIKLEIILLLILILFILITVNRASVIQGYVVKSQENSLSEEKNIIPKNLGPLIDSFIAGKSTLAPESSP